MQIFSVFLPIIAQIFQFCYVWNTLQQVKDIFHCKLHYILFWNILIVNFIYLEWNWNISAVSIFFYHWYSMFHVKNYDLVYYNEQQMHLATMWSALIFQYSLNIVQFIVRMRSNKNHKMRHSRKKLWVRQFFPQPLDI